MIKKTGTLLLALIVGLSLVMTPILTVATAEAATQEIEQNADSWRYEEGHIDYGADKTVFQGDDSKLPSGSDSIGGCTIAWGKLNGDFYNNEGDIIQGAYRKGMDISKWQKDIDWNKVKTSSDIDFVIIRCGYGTDKKSYDDTKWERNVEACERLGIPYGVYLYSYATSLSEAKSEAKHTLRLLEGHKPEYPIFYDLEDKKVKAKGRTNIIKYANTYCEMIEDAGYEAGIYASLTWWNNYLNDSSLDKYDKWVAQWNSKCTYSKDFMLWQCTSSGTVPGISGRVDINFDFTPRAEDNQPVAEDDSYKAIVKSKVNYRTGPGTSYTKKGYYKKGKEVTVRSITSNGWAKLSTGYYVNNKWLKKAAADKSDTVSSYKVKTTDNLNYRTGPGTKYKKKGTYKKGKVLTIVSKDGGWGKMSNGYYVYLKYTKKI